MAKKLLFTSWSYRMIVEAASRIYQGGIIDIPEKSMFGLIAGEMSTSPADIYRFFRSKDELDKAVRKYQYQPKEPPRNPESELVPPPYSGPPKLGSAGQALPLPEQDHFLSLWPAMVA